MLVHGWATNSRVWSHQRPLFEKLNAVAIDLPGHSKVDRWLEPTFWPGVEKIKKSIGTEDTIAIGWSLGGNLLLALALEKPKKLKGIVLVGCTPSYVKRRDFPYGQSKSLIRRMRIDLRVDFRRTMERFYQTNFSDLEKNNGDFQSYIESLRETGASINEGDMIRVLDALTEENLIAYLPSITIPVMLVHGSLDGVCPVGASRYLMEKLPRAELRIIKGVGHAPFLTRSEEFNKIVRAFIEKRMTENDQE